MNFSPSHKQWSLGGMERHDVANCYYDQGLVKHVLYVYEDRNRNSSINSTTDHWLFSQSKYYIRLSRFLSGGSLSCIQIRSLHPSMILQLLSARVGCKICWGSDSLFLPTHSCNLQVYPGTVHSLNNFMPYLWRLLLLYCRKMKRALNDT